MIRRLNENKVLFYISIISLFIIMFIFNKYTLIAVDDYDYLYSYYHYYNSGEWVRINNVFDIFPSMYTHWFTSNGRLVAHFFAQLFLMLPAFIFDMVNSVMFLLLILVVYKYFWRKKSGNLFLLWTIFAILWYFIPAFGQTILWLDGSCNYLWGAVLGLWYLYPYFSLIRGEVVLKHSASRWLFIIAGVLVGGYLETMSFGVLMTSILILIIYRFANKKAAPMWTYFSIIAMSVGFIFMMAAPGTIKNKVSATGLGGYVENFLQALDMYMSHLFPLLIVFVIMLAWIIMKGIFSQNMWNAVICFLISLATNFMHCVAAYYPERNMLACTLFLIIAIGFLANELWDTEGHIWLVCAAWCVIILAGGQFFKGGYDIYRTYEQCIERERIIENEKRAGNLDIELPLITPETKYSAKYGLTDLNTTTSDIWPNSTLAQYYGVDSIIGK